MIFPFVCNTTYLVLVDAHDADSDGKIVAMVVGGGAAVVVAFD